MTSNKFTNQMVNVLFNLQSSMTRNIKANFSSLFKENMLCKLKCKEKDIDTQQHLLTCSELLKSLTLTEIENTNAVNYNDIFGSLEQQRLVVQALARLLEIRDQLLEEECLPVGLITGPTTAVTNL